MEHPLTPAQCRMARAAVGWSARQLAAASKVGIATIKRFEQGDGDRRRSTMIALQRALEAAGVDFIGENGGGAGVRLHDPERRGATTATGPDQDMVLNS